VTARIVIPAESFPLVWPPGRPRSRFRERTLIGRDSSIGDALTAVRDELRRMKVGTSVISSNLPTRNDGQPRADSAPRGDDHGVAVYWSTTAIRGGDRVTVPHCMSCDRWQHIRQNLRAIALTLAALRGVDRWGAATLEQAFTGFAALPAGDGDTTPTERPWREVLAVPADGWTVTAPASVVLRYARDQARALLKLAHPDAGGTDAAAAEINVALAAAEAELGAAP
jgi:hypothetical protein